MLLFDAVFRQSSSPLTHIHTTWFTIWLSFIIHNSAFPLSIHRTGIQFLEDGARGGGLFRRSLWLWQHHALCQEYILQVRAKLSSVTHVPGMKSSYRSSQACCDLLTHSLFLPFLFRVFYDCIDLWYASCCHWVISLGSWSFGGRRRKNETLVLLCNKSRQN